MSSTASSESTTPQLRDRVRKAAPNRRARTARRHLRRAIVDLTHDVAEAKGAHSESVQHARAEVARIRAMAAPDRSSHLDRDGDGVASE